MPIRQFTYAELTVLGVPPEDPSDVEYSDTIIDDSPMLILKYTQHRRCVFTADDGRTYAVTYEAPINTGDYDLESGMPDNHGWTGGTVDATEVTRRPVMVTLWQPVGDDDPTNDPDTALDRAIDLYEEAGYDTPDALRVAGELFAAQYLAQAQVAAALALPDPADDHDALQRMDSEQYHQTMGYSQALGNVARAIKNATIPTTEEI